MISVNNSYEVIMQENDKLLQELCPFNKLMDMKMNIWQMTNRRIKYFFVISVTIVINWYEISANRKTELVTYVRLHYHIGNMQVRNNVCDNNGRKNNSTMKRITSIGQSTRLSSTCTNIADSVIEWKAYVCP